MPEGHVIHRLSAQLEQHFGRQALRVTSPQGRFSAEAAQLNGETLARALPWGKHLFLHFGLPQLIGITRPATAARIVHIHLGLIGTFRIEPYSPTPPVGQVRLHLHRIAAEGGEDMCMWGNALAANLRGPQWCRLITPAEQDTTIDGLGVDPLHPLLETPPRAGADAANESDARSATGSAAGTYPATATEPTQQPTATHNHPHAEIAALNTTKKTELDQFLTRSSRSIGSILMDQKHYAGVGNIYRAEALFRCRIHPQTPARELASEEKDALWNDLVELMRYGVTHGRIDTVKPEHEPEAMGRAPRRDDHGGEVYVYRRAGQPCHVCATPIAQRHTEGRNLFWCPGCQPDPGVTSNPAAPPVR